MRCAIQVQFEPQLWSPERENFCNAIYLCLPFVVGYAMWWKPSCVSPRLFRFYLVFGGWGCWTNLTIFFIKTLCFVIVDDCWCHSMSVFCRMWTCCTSSGLELKSRKVSRQICTELYIKIVVYDGHWLRDLWRITMHDYDPASLFFSLLQIN